MAFIEGCPCVRGDLSLDPRPSSPTSPSIKMQEAGKKELLMFLLFCLPNKKWEEGLGTRLIVATLTSNLS